MIGVKKFEGPSYREKKEGSKIKMKGENTGGFRGGRGGTRPPPPLKFSEIRVLGDIHTCT